MKKVRKVIIILISIPVVSIVLILILRYKLFPSNEEIIRSIKNTNGYVTDVEYTIINAKNNYTEEATINYTKGINTRIQFKNNIEKNYNDDGTITINYNNYQYNTNYNNDIVYSLAIINKVMNSSDEDSVADLKSITEERDEWGEKEYLVLKYCVNNTNRNVNNICLYINKKDKIPVVMKVYDYENRERAIIVYKSFKYIK